MCSLKSEGGLGFRHMKAFNLSLLANLGWRLMHHLESLVSRLLKTKYFLDNFFMEAVAEH